MQQKHTVYWGLPATAERLCRLYNWSHSSLIFNSSKSCVLSYHSPQSDPVIFDYSIRNRIIDRHSICKDLGVLFSDSLTWSSQVELVLKKAYSTFRMIKRVFPGATTPTNVKKKLYLSLVVPVVFGGPPLSVILSQKNFKEELQNICCMITNSTTNPGSVNLNSFL